MLRVLRPRPLPVCRLSFSGSWSLLVLLSRLCSHFRCFIITVIFVFLIFVFFIATIMFIVAVVFVVIFLRALVPLFFIVWLFAFFFSFFLSSLSLPLLRPSPFSFFYQPRSRKGWGNAPLFYIRRIPKTIEKKRQVRYAFSLVVLKEISLKSVLSSFRFYWI